MSRKTGKVRSLRRRRPFRVPRQCLLVVCEGSKTEPGYFDGLCRELTLSSVEVEVVGGKSGSAPITVVNWAVDRKRVRQQRASRSPTLPEYDDVWCVMDVEAPVPHGSLARALSKAKANSLRVALSNPCFEYWYLLHFRKTSALMPSCKRVVKMLRKHLPKYKKTLAPPAFEELFRRTGTAITHAEEVLKEKHWGANLSKCNPSTHVHLLVKCLRSMAARPSTTVR